MGPKKNRLNKFGIVIKTLTEEDRSLMNAALQAGLEDEAGVEIKAEIGQKRNNPFDDPKREDTDYAPRKYKPSFIN